MISFVFYFSSKRIDNLKQTLNFFKKREDSDENEIILICNDFCYEKFDLKYKLYNLKLISYNKPKLCNLGVKKSNGELIALLDSDRILPMHYFKKQSNIIKDKEFISSKNLIKLDKDYSDQDIENEKFIYTKDEKTFFSIHKKNVFSGNTLFFKKDYLDCGKMDESYVGYGYADNDMTVNVLSKKCKIILNTELEIHLFHEQSFFYEGKVVNYGENKFFQVCSNNYIKLKKKWKKEIKGLVKI